MNLKKYFLGYLLVFLTNLISAQEIVATSGGDISGNGSVNYSVGQTFFNSSESIDFNITQGVQQAFEISTILGTDDVDFISLKCAVYPNPTTDFLNLDIRNYNQHHLKYSLYDLNGKDLSTDKIKGNRTRVEMREFPVATYFLRIYNTNNKVIKTFKIIKH